MSFQELDMDEVGQITFQRRPSFLPNGVPVLTQKVLRSVNGAKVTDNLTVVLTKEPEGGYTAFSPDMKGARAQGENEEETLSNMAEVLSMMRESRQQYAPFVMCYQFSQ